MIDINLVNNMLKNDSIESFIEFNKKTDEKFKIDVIKYWINIRENYTFIEQPIEGKWFFIDIRENHNENNINYIFIDIKRKLWRTSLTRSEGYGMIGDEYIFKSKEQ